MRSGESLLPEIAVAMAISCFTACEPGSSADRFGRSAQTIIGGAVDGDDPGVVAFVQDGYPYCSGTLVAPRVVLTAAHCLNGAAPRNVFMGVAPSLGGAFIDVLDYRVHPRFDPTTLENDVGVVLLAEASAHPSWPLLPTPMDATFVGMNVRLVGFGISQPHEFGRNQRKRQGSGAISAVANSSFATTPDPAITCKGDSGGPVFISLGGTEYLAGITSSGDSSCTQYAENVRLDRYIDFVSAYVRQTSDGVAKVGDRCYYAANCESGICFAASEGSPSKYCSSPCAGNGDCPTAMACVSDESQSRTCRYISTVPGTLGSTCQNSFDCDQGICASTAASAPRSCSMVCGPDSKCPSGYQCHQVADEIPVSVCARSSAGCSFAAADGVGNLPLGLILWIAMLGRFQVAGWRKALSGQDVSRRRASHI